MRVALAQISSSDDVEENRRTISDYVQKASSGGADLVVFPEAAASRAKTSPANDREHGEALDGPFVSHLRRLSSDHDIVIVAGMGEHVPNSDKVFNTLVVAQAGEVVGAYRKMHLFDALGSMESDTIIPGDGDVLVFPLAGQMVGIAICYDLRFPELGRLLVDQGATTLIYSSAWVKGNLKEMHWETLLRARAIENVSYVVGVSQCELRHTGASMAVDPMGVIMTSLGDEPGLAFADTSATHLEACRTRNPSLQNRRIGTPG
jgi:predicted amidohydrolase